jgi:hypothetical protein
MMELITIKMAILQQIVSLNWFHTFNILSFFADGNQLVQLRGCLRSFISINVQADL